MNQLSGRQLARQPAISQRNSFLARRTKFLSGEGRDTLSLLYIGSGPIPSTDAFVSRRFDIVGADVSQIDDASIGRLHPGEPLSFEDAAFELVQKNPRHGAISCGCTYGGLPQR